MPLGSMTTLVLPLLQISTINRTRNLSNAHVMRDSIGAATQGASVQRAIK